ncbi:MAG TPA: hypothetical protein VKA19_04625, partial [Alphaproteobacteria bacterium]|nr:hypothetical protein [Alphaproteobacteria bacterium]
MKIIGKRLQINAVAQIIGIFDNDMRHRSVSASPSTDERFKLGCASMIFSRSQDIAQTTFSSSLRSIGVSNEL